MSMTTSNNDNDPTNNDDGEEESPRPSQSWSSSKRLRLDPGSIEDDEATTQQQAPHPPVVLRASSLPNPTLQLIGHTGSVYALEYSPSGSALVSASFDKTLLLWSHPKHSHSSNDYDDEDDLPPYQNYNVLKGHKNAVLDCHWMLETNEDCLISCGADKMVMLWDACTGQRLRQWKDGNSIPNACVSLSSHVCAAVRDDGSVYVHDIRQKKLVSQFMSSEYPLLAVTGTSSQLFCSGIDSGITCWDIGQQRKVYRMAGHADTITCLAMHPEQTHILSNSMDSTCKVWDIRPFVTTTKRRQVKQLRGHAHSAEKGLLKCAWSGDGKLISAGSADAKVHIWDEFTGHELYLLPGHKGCVHAVAFHPHEPVIASGASDKQIFVGELD